MFDADDYIVGIYDHEKKILYLNEEYHYFERTFLDYITRVKIEVYVDTSGSRTLQDLQKIR
jgi:hypothetical protein